MAIKFSEAIRRIDIKKFVRRDDIEADAKRYCKEDYKKGTKNKDNSD
jgi:hypothetical protein